MLRNRQQTIPSTLGPIQKDMRTLKQDLIKGLFLIACLLLLDNYFLIICSLFLAYLLFTPIYVNFLISCRPENILIFKKDNSNKIDYFNIVCGIIILGWGIYKNTTSNIIHFDGKYILGLFFILNGLLNSRQYLLIITKKSVIFNEGFILVDWRLRFLDYINLHKDKIEFIKLPQTTSFDFIKTPDELLRIEMFLNNLEKVQIIKK